jgi:hypothetical protein
MKTISGTGTGTGTGTGPETIAAPMYPATACHSDRPTPRRPRKLGRDDHRFGTARFMQIILK